MIEIEVGTARTKTLDQTLTWPVVLRHEGRELRTEYVGGLQGGKPTVVSVLADILIKTPRGMSHQQWFRAVGTSNGHEYAACQRRASELCVLLGRLKFERLFREFIALPIGSLAPFQRLGLV